MSASATAAHVQDGAGDVGGFIGAKPDRGGRDLHGIADASQRHRRLGALDENLRRDLEDYLREFFRALNDPASTAQWVSDLFPTGEPMRSLRDVEEQAPVFTRGGRP